ncbi:hypothetical protein EST38_g5918 [Candolleomyces aberdarensis]|uniref:F-box domain-containing protein n=1 Tax=Candolleomyces aberdarensis TaxID=2316362 RepID=A0A4Q2DL21_9AGAR|nr:hypothetical protein EST38_g5918 [Candolleomyces aberdarensis]
MTVYSRNHLAVSKNTTLSVLIKEVRTVPETIPPPKPSPINIVQKIDTMSPSIPQASGEENDAQVHQAIQDCHSLLKQIQDVEMKLQDLKNTHMAKIGYINRHSTRLSPMSRMPLEIQQYIFEYAVNSSGSSRTGTVLTISSVCGQWRYGALKASSLWSHISITLPKFPLPHPFYWEREGIQPHQWLEVKINTLDVSNWRANVQVLMDFAKTFAARSRNYPLALTFDATKLFDFGGSDESRVLISSMLDGFSTLSNHCWTFSVA